LFVVGFNGTVRRNPRQKGFAPPGKTREIVGFYAAGNKDPVMLKKPLVQHNRRTVAGFSQINQIFFSPALVRGAPGTKGVVKTSQNLPVFRFSREAVRAGSHQKRKLFSPKVRLFKKRTKTPQNCFRRRRTGRIVYDNQNLLSLPKKFLQRPPRFPLRSHRAGEGFPEQNLRSGGSLKIIRFRHPKEVRIRKFKGKGRIKVGYMDFHIIS
jgi:hypothetical protein